MCGGIIQEIPEEISGVVFDGVILWKNSNRSFQKNSWQKSWEKNLKSSIEEFLQESLKESA